ERHLLVVRREEIEREGERLGDRFAACEPDGQQDVGAERGRQAQLSISPGHAAVLSPPRPSWHEVSTDSSDEQARRREQLQQRVRLTEHRLRDEVAAHEAEDVAVTRVAAGDPRVLVTGHAADDRQEVEDEPEDPGPAMLDPQLTTDELRDERLER